MTWMMRTGRRRPGLVVATLLAVLIDGWRGPLRASDELAGRQFAGLRTGGIEASISRLAPIEAGRLMQDQPQSVNPTAPDLAAGNPVAELCRASLVEKVGMVFSLGVGSIMFGYGLREKAKHDTIWTPDGKSEVGLGAAAIGLSFWLLQDIRHRSRACAAVAR